MGVARRITARDSHTVPNARDEERQRHRTPIGAMPGSSFGERDTGLIGTGSPTGRADSAEVKPGEMNWWRANNPGAKEENLLGSRQGPSDEVEDDANAPEVPKPSRDKSRPREKPGDYLKRLGATKRVERAAQHNSPGVREDFRTALRKAAAGR